MKIAIVVPEFPTISETFILNHITGLMDAGHQVTIFSLKKKSIDTIHRTIDDYQLLNRTKFLRHIPSNKTVRRFLAICLIIFYAFRLPVKLSKALMYLLFQNRRDFYLNLFFLFLIGNQEYDVCHFHFGHTGLLGVFLKKIGFSAKTVTSFHGHDVHRIPLQRGKDYYRDLFETGDCFIANSQYTKEQIVNLGCPDNKITVIPVGLHIKHYPFKERHYPTTGPLKILTIGRLVEKKGHRYSIQAIAELIQQGFEIHYTIAGDGPLKNNLQELIGNLNITDHVTFTGPVTQKQAVQLYNASHLFILASVTAPDGDKEGQGLVLQEAQSCGLPVISTLHNGIPEGVLDGQSGILVPEKDTKALAEALKNLISNPSDWPEMGHAGRHFVESKYDMTVLIPQLLRLYES